MAKDFVDRVLKKLFGGQADDSLDEKEPVKEKLKRVEGFDRARAEWEASDRCSQVLADIRAAYTNAMNGSEHDVFHVHLSPQANGFFFDGRVGIEVGEFSFLLDRFRDIVSAQGYSLYSSERKHVEKSSSVQVTDRHYLKPSISAELRVPLNQRYGNIILEYVTYGDKPAYLKVMANCYSDRNYSEALSFWGLAEKLFSAP